MSLTLTLVRHAQTHLNARALIQGSTDSPLTKTGKVGLAVTAQHLSQRPFDAAYTSPQGRAVLSAAEIVRRRAGLALQADAGLREYAFGDFERRPERDLDAVIAFPELMAAVIGGSHPGLPGGEPGAWFMSRVSAAFERIVAAHPEGEVLVVAHGVTLATWIARMTGTPYVSLPWASVSRVEVTDGHVRVLEVGTDIAGHGRRERSSDPVDLPAALTG